jgi:hypothetical protein
LEEYKAYPCLEKIFFDDRGERSHKMPAIRYLLHLLLAVAAIVLAAAATSADAQRVSVGAGAGYTASQTLSPEMPSNSARRQLA